jgi:hypothetical protein
MSTQQMGTRQEVMFLRQNFGGSKIPANSAGCRYGETMVFVLALISLTAGCGQGPTVGQVTGVISYKGRPMKGIEVSFDPVATGRRSKAVSGANGTYELRYTRQDMGALIGDHQVRVSWPVQGQQDLRKRRKFPIPPSYNTKSTQTFVVKSGSNTFDLNIDAQ